MRCKTLAALALGTLVATAACAPPPAEQVSETAPEAEDAQQAAEDAIVALAADWDAALMAQDVEAALALFTEDPAMMPPGAQASVGIQQVAGTLESMFAGGTIQVRNDVDGVRASGDLAVGWGPYTLTVTAPDGQAMTETGKWMCIVERQADGTWKGVRNIWNRDTEPMGM